MDFFAKAVNENPLHNAGWPLLWETRSGAGRAFSKGKGLFGKPAEKRGGLSKNLERTALPFFPFLAEG
jgi:hypothetical protein